MHNLSTTVSHHRTVLKSGVFITFSGNCQEALEFYQSCFGGILSLQRFENELNGYSRQPIINGCLISDRIIIHGSDMVPDEGRKIGNYISIFISCKDETDRKELLSKLSPKMAQSFEQKSKLIEIKDMFSVRWILGV